MDKILEDRENRYERILELIDVYKLPVLCGKINYPGRDKNTDEYRKAYGLLAEKLFNKFKEYAEYYEPLTGFDGSAMIMALRMDKVEAKITAVTIEEESAIGRVFDIDIYDKDGVSISRESIGMSSRKCVLCGENPRICAKTGKHELNDIIDAVNKIINDSGENYET